MGDGVENGKFSELEVKLVGVMKNYGIKDEIKEIIVTEPPELKGEHMATVTVYAQIIFKNPEIRPKNIFVKLYSSNAAHSEMTKNGRIMEKESSFFSDFLPTAQKFCKDYKGCEDLLNFFPRFIYGDAEFIVFDNMVLDDTYVMLSKDDKQDLYTAKMVLTNLAKLHSVSYAMSRNSGVEKYRERWSLNLTESFDIDLTPMMSSFYDNIVTTCINMLKNYPKEGSEHTLEVLNSMVGKISGEVSKILKNPNVNSLVVLNHGDCWNNNMLFRLDEETKKVKEHIFIDFQITRFGSPNLDISYFLYTSVKPSIRRANFIELMKHYFDQLSETLSLFHTKSPITFSEFIEDYKLNSKVGFLFGLMMLTAVGAFKDMDVEEMPSTSEGIVEYFNNAVDNWIKNNPEKADLIVTEIIECIKENENIQKLVI